MHATLLSMLSTTSLQAFSGASTTASLQRTTPAQPAARLVREQSSSRSASPASPLPDTKPGLPPPRGSLLNLSV